MIKVVDSSKSDDPIPGHTVHCVTYCMSWQLVVCNIRDAKYPVARVHQTLLAYYGRATTLEEKQLRAYRAANFFRAYPLRSPLDASGFARQPFHTSQVLLAREKFDKILEVIGNPVLWDWAWVRKEIESYSIKDREYVKKHLRQRAMKPEPKGSLRYFLNLLDEVPITNGSSSSAMDSAGSVAFGPDNATGADQQDA